MSIVSHQAVKSENIAGVEMKSVKCPTPSENRSPERKHSEKGSTIVTPILMIKDEIILTLPGSIFILRRDQRTIRRKKVRIVGLIKFCSAG